MRIQKNTAMTLFMTAGIAGVILLASAVAAPAGIVDPCNTTVTASGGSVAICPLGDGQTLADQGTVIHITVRDATNHPVAGILASDMWLIGCPSSDLVLCSGSMSIDADGPTDVNGYTTMSGTIRGSTSGLVDGVSVVVQGVVIGCPTTCLPVAVRSFDLDGNGLVNISDLLFLATYYDPVYNAECDFDNDGKVNLSDVARFSFHFAQTQDHDCP